MSIEKGSCYICNSPDGTSEAKHHPRICEPCNAELSTHMVGTSGTQAVKARILRAMTNEKAAALNTEMEYALRGISPELMNKAKHMAVDQGTSVKDVFLQAIDAYLK